MKQTIAAVLLILCFASCSRVRPAVVIVSLDAFRWDYPDMYDTPNLDSIAADGVRTIMAPSYPASTFPNHYTIATGLVPDHNGIVNSMFWDSETQKLYSMLDSTVRYDPAYYLGEPIWITAQKQGLRTGNIYWVGSDIPHDGMLPTYSRRWDAKPHWNFQERVDEAIRQLSLPDDERPQLLMVYFDEPDGTGHHFGPKSEETGNVVHYLDSLVGVMYRAAKAMPYPVDFIVTADHGMTDISDERFVNIDDYLKRSWYSRAVSFNPTNIYVNEGCRDSIVAALSGVEHISVWLHGEVPDSLEYGNSPRTGDVIVAPDPGWQFGYSSRHLMGQHGYAPQVRDMQVAFYAAGPSFVQQSRPLDGAEFRNVDIYPMLAHILGIRPAKVDGNLDRVRFLLK